MGAKLEGLRVRWVLSLELREVRPALEALARLKVGKRNGAEYHALVAPRSHVLLPLRNGVRGRRRITVWLRVGIDRIALMRATEAKQLLTPMVDAVVALPEIIFTPPDYGIKEELTPEAMSMKQVHGTLALLDLRCCVAAEAYARVQPVYLGQTDGKLLGDQTCIESLVEVDVVATEDYFVQLFDSIGASGKDVVVHKDEFAFAIGDTVHVPVRADAPLLARHDTPRTLVGAATREEAIGEVGRHLRIDGEVGLAVVNLLRQ